jgi:hypothetical protein
VLALRMALIMFEECAALAVVTISPQLLTPPTPPPPCTQQVHPSLYPVLVVLSRLRPGLALAVGR